MPCHSTTCTYILYVFMRGGYTGAAYLIISNLVSNYERGDSKLHKVPTYLCIKLVSLPRVTHPGTFNIVGFLVL